MAEEIEFEDAFLNGNNEQHGLSQGSNQVCDGCTYDGTGSSASDSSEGESDESSESEKSGGCARLGCHMEVGNTACLLYNELPLFVQLFAILCSICCVRNFSILPSRHFAVHGHVWLGNLGIYSGVDLLPIRL